MQWKPIETCPAVAYENYIVADKDGDFFIAYPDSKSKWCSDQVGIYGGDPDFWIELPPIPTTETEL